MVSLKRAIIPENSNLNVQCSWLTADEMQMNFTDESFVNLPLLKPKKTLVRPKLKRSKTANGV